MKILYNRKYFSVSIVGILCLLVYFIGLGSNGLWDLDEGLYANVAREMSVSGNYVEPRVNALPFYEKPPLIYWTAAAFFKILGRSEFTTRLPSALASTIVAFLILSLGTKLFGKKSGLLGTCLFVLCPLSFGTARQLTTDATLNLWIFCAICSFIVLEILPDTRKSIWRGGFWFSCAMGVLAKGLPGILIPVTVVVISSLIRTKYDIRKTLGICMNLQPLLGVPLFLAVAVPWHVIAYQVSGAAFFNEYIVKQHLQRFRGGDISHIAPFWFFIPGFAVGAFPWSFFSLAALRESTQVDDNEMAASARIILKVWAVTVFVMFSISGSKLISYIFPLYPAAAMVVGDWLSRHLEVSENNRKLVRPASIAFGISLTLFGVILFRQPISNAIANYSHKPVHLDQIPAFLFQWAVGLFSIWSATTGIVLLFLLRKKPEFASYALICGMTLFLITAQFGLLPGVVDTTIAPIQELGKVAGEKWKSDPRRLAIVTFSGRRPSVLFHLPDDMIINASHGSWVKEVPEKELVDTEVFRPIPQFIIADEKACAEWLVRPGFRKLESRGGWALLQKD